MCIFPLSVLCFCFPLQVIRHCAVVHLCSVHDFFRVGWSWCASHQFLNGHLLCASGTIGKFGLSSWFILVHPMYMTIYMCTISCDLLLMNVVIMSIFCLLFLHWIFHGLFCWKYGLEDGKTDSCCAKLIHEDVQGYVKLSKGFKLSVYNEYTVVLWDCNWARMS